MKILSLKRCLPLAILAALFSPNALSDNGPRDYGKDEFLHSCAICHGETGKGDGPISHFLTEKPSNLTQLSKENDGHFPFFRVLKTIDGRQNVELHGPRFMPVWGDRYKEKGMREGFSDIESDLYARALILELIVYLRSIQEQ